MHYDTEIDFHSFSEKHGHYVEVGKELLFRDGAVVHKYFSIRDGSTHWQCVEPSEMGKYMRNKIKLRYWQEVSKRRRAKFLHYKSSLNEILKLGHFHGDPEEQQQVLQRLKKSAMTAKRKLAEATKRLSRAKPVKDRRKQEAIAAHVKRNAKLRSAINTITLDDDDENDDENDD